MKCFESQGTSFYEMELKKKNSRRMQGIDDDEDEDDNVDDGEVDDDGHENDDGDDDDWRKFCFSELKL